MGEGSGFLACGFTVGLQRDDWAAERALKKTADRGRIARMVVDLGRSLDMQVIAEGVENEAQFATPMAMGCEEAQGYLFARPMPTDQLQVWLRDQSQVQRRHSLSTDASGRPNRLC
jgi:predicted signal transduction protein with EAL and GGDEF domain